MMCGLRMVEPHDVIAALVHLIFSRVMTVFGLLRVNHHENRHCENQCSQGFHTHFSFFLLIKWCERLAGSTDSDSSRLTRFPPGRRANRVSQSLSVFWSSSRNAVSSRSCSWPLTSF